mgnify:CR=1 FL=1
MALTPEILATFRNLLDEAKTAGEPEPTAMTLATADAAGRVSARIVLLKSFDEHGFVFHSNYDSIKGAQLAAHDNAALCLLWKTLRDQVQVRIEGVVKKASEAESDAYFAYRPRGSQLGAWASAQSSVVKDRATLEAQLAEVEARFLGRDVPTPEHWGGYRIAPRTVELWQGRPNRLHDRLCYTRVEGTWRVDRLSP